MRIVLRLSVWPALAVVCLAVAWTASLSTFVCDRFDRIASYLHECLISTCEFIPRLAKRAQPIRWIWMAATALNGRQVGGVRIHGFLGRPAVGMLTG